MTTTAPAPMTDTETLEILRRSPKDFAKSLVSQFDQRKSLSPRQWPWVHTLAKEQIEREAKEAEESRWASSRVEAVVQDEIQMDGVFKLFAAAKGSQLQFPKIRLAVKAEEGYRHYRLSLTGERSTTPGCIAINCKPAGYVGRVSSDGLFFPGAGVSLESHPGLLDRLTDLATDPVKVAMEYGRLTGQCCFCGLTLTDEKSTDVGYGPICAAKWSLPHGNKTGKRTIEEILPCPAN